MGGLPPRGRLQPLRGRPQPLASGIPMGGTVFNGNQSRNDFYSVCSLVERSIQQTRFGLCIACPNGFLAVATCVIKIPSEISLLVPRPRRSLRYSCT